MIRNSGGRVLAFGAHPDDMEIGAGGMIARLAKEGATVTMAVVCCPGNSACRIDEAKRGRDFAGRDWNELPDDPELAIQAAAWYLHNLARQLPARRAASYTADELLALGYNAGAGSMRSFAAGAKPGRVAQSYLDRLHDNWARAAAALRSTR